MALGSIALLACQRAPSDLELDRLRGEAIKANAEVVARMPASREPGFTLTVSGQIGKPPTTIGWSELQRIGTTHVHTINTQDPNKKTPTDFRGVLVRDLLDRFQPMPEATEATMVAIDGFRATVQIADAHTYRMLFAIEADGAPIPRSGGGPIFLIQPLSESGPELKAKYPDRFWTFYVTHFVIGTEAPHLVIDGHVLDRAALDKLPTASFDGTVGWKVDWPADAVHLRGVSLADAIAAAGVTLPPRGRIVIRGKAPIHSDPDKPTTLAIENLERCKPLLAMRSGLEEAPIPAKLGGPIALAITPCGAQYGDRLWVTFVEQILVEPR